MICKQGLDSFCSINIPGLQGSRIMQTSVVCARNIWKHNIEFSFIQYDTGCLSAAGHLEICKFKSHFEEFFLFR